MVDGVASASLSQPDQAAVNQGGGVIAEMIVTMMFNQLMQTVSQFQETMQDDPDYPNSYDGF